MDTELPDYLLDTNHASPLVTPGHPLKTRIEAVLVSGGTVSIAAPCIAEAIFGFGILPRAEANRNNWRQVVAELTVYGIDSNDAEVAADLQISLRKQGWQLKTVDALVASVALRYGLTLLTTDGDFSHVPGLHCENWLVSGVP